MTEELQDSLSQPRDSVSDEEITETTTNDAEVVQGELTFSQTILDKLPADFRDGAISNHNAMRDVVSRYIQAGKLSEGYRLPEINELADRAATLMPVFDVMQQTGWVREVMFVPKGLSWDTWDSLLTGHQLADGQTSGGLAHSVNILDSFEPPVDEADKWEVVVISTAIQPPIRDVSSDGKYGSNAPKVDKLLAKLSDKTEASALSTVRRFSPSRSAYLAAQLTRFARGQPPLDSNNGGDTWTIAKELHETGIWQLGWEQPTNRVTCTCYPADKPSYYIGLRPTVSEHELDLKLL